MRRGSPPLIGITADISSNSSNRSHVKSEPTLFLPLRYVRAVELAGAVSLILPAIHSSRGLRRYMNLLDGLLISGEQRIPLHIVASPAEHDLVTSNPAELAAAEDPDS